VNDQATTQTVWFPELLSKPVVARLDQAHSSSDGGAVLLKAVDGRLGLTQALARCLRDPRQPGKVTHTGIELLRQRVYGIALGYPDANDAQALRHDPMHKLLLERDPIHGEGLGSQPTLSRFENAVRRADLYRMGEALADTVIERHRRRLGARCRQITLDFDPTDDPTHGQQQFSFFHGHYDTYCYLPLVGTMSLNDEPEQWLIAALLRPGNSTAYLGLVALLRRVLPKLRAAFPRARIRVRLDGGFGVPQVLDFLDEAAVQYVVGLGTTAPLKRRARTAQAAARREFRRMGQTVSVFGETQYRTKTSWPHRRRVIYKAEVVQSPGREPKDNLRFVVTNLRQAPEQVYRTYTDRGDAENRIKELKNDLALGRTSCSGFAANQFRVLLTAVAYALMQELRQKACSTDERRAQVSTLRARWLKLAVWVEVSVRRIVLHLPCAFPARDGWLRVAHALTAAPT
jgi:hypothetical protein